MTDGLDQAVIDVGLDLLRADSGLVVVDGSEPGPHPAPPYVLVYTTMAWPGDDPDSQSLDAMTSRGIARWICHSIGETAKASRAVAQRVRTQLMDARPAVDGVTCGFIRFEQDDPAYPDRNKVTGVEVIDTMTVYRLTVDK